MQQNLVLACNLDLDLVQNPFPSLLTLRYRRNLGADSDKTTLINVASSIMLPHYSLYIGLPKPPADPLPIRSTCAASSFSFSFIIVIDYMIKSLG